MRTKGAAVGTATNWIFNFMVVEIVRNRYIPAKRNMLTMLLRTDTARSTEPTMEVLYHLDDFER